ncbi:nuclear transport factor 2 family protein [Tateyamaria sp. SN3-11]|uniref:nuclear transport factor 2 family protein n=1 Tax=Tateyamaria sp. SN3-11 TaxID=3092147 RepID=UPI0039E8F305
MSLMDVANELVAGCRENRTTENLEKLYAADAVSVEAMDNGMGREVQGLEAIRGKHDWWDSTFEVLDANVSDPMPNGDDRFAVIFELKAKHNESGEVSDMKEVALYTVANGKISREEFFYGM